MDLASILARTEAGEMFWYADYAARGPNGEVELNYLCSIGGYDLEVSTVNNSITLYKSSINLESDTITSDLLLAIETSVAAAKARYLAEFSNLITPTEE